MQDTSQHIINRHGLKLFVRTFIPSRSEGLVFIAHGLSDNHDTPNMRTLRRAFEDRNYSIVVWDATHSSWGQSEGRSEDANFTRHYHDLEDVIAWARSQKWHQKTYALAGYSLGGIAAGTYAARHSKQVNNLVLVAPVVSGAYLRRAIPFPIRLLWRLRGSIVQPGRYRKRYSWDFIVDGLDYDLTLMAQHLTMPTLIIGARRDIFIKPITLQLLFEAMASQDKKLELIKKAGHRFAKYQEVVYGEVSSWLQGRGRRRLFDVNLAAGIKNLIARLY